MLPIGFAALLGLVLGCFFRVAVLAPGVAVAAIFALAIERSSGAGTPATIAAAIAAALCLQFGYFLGASVGLSARRARRHPPSSARLGMSADL